MMKRVLALSPLVLSILVSLYFFFVSSPNDLVNVIGVQNAYILMYVAAVVGGMTTFNTVPYYSVMLILASAGVNPVLLGATSALGVMTGDSFSYLIGRGGAVVVPASFQRIFDRINQFAVTRPRLFPLICFLYGSFSPLSNDFITISSGIAKITYWRVMLPLALGNIVFNIGLAYLSRYAYDVVQAIFIG